MNRLSITASLLLIFLVSCYKPELVQFKKVSKPPKGCNVSSFYGQPYGEDGEPFHGFTKMYDSQGRVVQVVAPLFSLILSDSIRLNVVYFDHAVKFVNDANSADTVITAQFNNQGQLIRMTGNTDYSLATTDYTYTSHKLSSISVGSVVLRFVYDGKGNVIRYESDNEGGLDNFEFQYDLSVKVTKQLYIDYIAGWIYNTFTLSQIMDWTPDLTPRNKRTHARILFDKTDPWYDVEFTDHTFDADGRLTSYLAAGYKMYQTWNCK